MRREPHRREYDFRPVDRADLALLGGWLREPHVARWWDDPAKMLAGIEDQIESISV